MKFRILSILLIISSGYALKAQQAASVTGILQAAADSVRQSTGIPGLTFSVVLPDNTLISVHSGFDDIDKKKPLTAESQMLAGSTGKTFFASLAFLAMQRNQISPDDLIYKYLSDKPWIDSLPNSKSITVRMLMNHSSGLGEYYELKNNMDVLVANPDKVWDPEEQIRLLSGRAPLFEAGKGWSYADTNYLVLAVILQKFYKKPLFDEIVERFIIPNKLSLTVPQRSRDLKNLSNGYTGKNNPFKIEGAVLKNGKHQINPQMEGAGGGFMSNSKDLARWAKIYYTASFVGEEIRTHAHTGVPAKTGKNHEYALGMQIRPSPYGNGYGHSGWFPGYITDLEYFPEINYACAIQINTDDGERLKFKNSRYYMLLLLKKCILTRQ
jgi:D-alanyl-D-alanine carboxypeptidase